MPNIENIKKEHILKAIARVDIEKVPKGRNYRKWALRYNNENYPCKLVVSWAHEVLTGQEIDTRNFSFTTDTAKAKLKDLGFEIIRVNN